MILPSLVFPGQGFGCSQYRSHLEGENGGETILKEVIQKDTSFTRKNADCNYVCLSGEFRVTSDIVPTGSFTRKSDFALSLQVY